MMYLPQIDIATPGNIEYLYNAHMQYTLEISLIDMLTISEDWASVDTGL